MHLSGLPARRTALNPAGKGALRAAPGSESGYGGEARLSLRCLHVHGRFQAGFISL